MEIKRPSRRIQVGAALGLLALLIALLVFFGRDSNSYPRNHPNVGKETGVPGMTVDGAHWLAERGIVATGTDTTAYEQIPAGAGHRVLPVHRVLLVDSGIHIVEHMACEEAAEAGLGEFLAVFAPLRVVGATGAPVRPLAVVPA